MKHDLLRRFAYIETCLYWGEGLTAPHLADVFGIARQNAQKVVEQYRHFNPNSMMYDRRKKRHVATDDFKPEIISVRTDHYLEYIRAIDSVEYYWDEKVWNEVPFESDDRYLIPPQHRLVIKTVLSAIREQQALYIRYRAKFRERAMIISPHYLVYANYRYHVRAYDHEKGWFIDVVLTRILQAEITTEAYVSNEMDQRWHTKLIVRFQINPELPKDVQHALRADYRLGEKDYRIINVRHAMLGYICREMERIDWKYGMRLWLDKDKCCYHQY